MKQQNASIQLMCVTVAAGAALLAAPRPAAATTFTVNETVDAINDNGMCSLREALVAANSNRTRNDCGLGQPGDVAVDQIILPSGTTFLLTENLHIKDAVNITTSTSTGRVTIQPGTLDNITGFTVMPQVMRVELHNIDLFRFKNQAITLAEGSQARVFDVTVQNGTSSGAEAQTGSIEVDADANLQLTRVVVNNQQQSIKGGALMVYPGGWATVGDCSFTNNTAQQFGGAIDIQSGGTVFCKRSTISGNSAEIAGGGVAISAGGTFVQNDCIVAGNSAPTSPNIHQF